MKRLLSRSLIATAIMAVAGGQTFAQTNSFVAGSPLSSPTLTGSATTGIHMVGMLVSWTWADGTSAGAAWAQLNATDCGVTGAGFSATFGCTRNTFDQGDIGHEGASRQAISTCRDGIDLVVDRGKWRAEDDQVGVGTSVREVGVVEHRVAPSQLLERVSRRRTRHGRQQIAATIARSAALQGSEQRTAEQSGTDDDETRHRWKQSGLVGHRKASHVRESRESRRWAVPQILQTNR